jgi:hypothetical protein
MRGRNRRPPVLYAWPDFMNETSEQSTQVKKNKLAMYHKNNNKSAIACWNIKRARDDTLLI